MFASGPKSPTLQKGLKTHENDVISCVSVFGPVPFDEGTSSGFGNATGL